MWMMNLKMMRMVNMLKLAIFKLFICSSTDCCQSEEFMPFFHLVKSQAIDNKLNE